MNIVLALAIAAAAEVRPALDGCDGAVVSRIVVSVGPATGITRAHVVRAYVLLREGEPCTERRRIDSERILRAQRFIAAAAVTAEPDGPGFVRVRVTVVDEFPWTGSIRAHGSRLDALSIGSQNLGGRGVTLAGGVARGNGYREGYSARIGQSGALGRPALAEAEWQRRALGASWRVQYAEPFFADDQRAAYHGALSQEVAYPTLLRPGAGDVVVRTRRAAYHAGYLRRVGRSRAGGQIALGGLMVMGTSTESSARLAMRGGQGLQPSDDSTLLGRYRPHANGRLGLLFGLRAVRFRTVTRFETLRAEQDLATGFEVDALVAPSFNRSAGARDVLLAGDVYLGRSGGNSFAALKLRIEGRRTGRADVWEGAVGSARLSWHQRVSLTRTRVVTATASALGNVAFPAQLTLRDAEGGLAGYPEGHDAGGVRAVMRYEERQLLPWLSRRAGLAAGWFVDAGQIWAGDVPFGRDAPARGSVGLSLVASYPATNKRMHRLDLALPVNRTAGDARIVLRLMSGDRTGMFWSEPLDVARVRASAGPISLVRW